MSFQRLFSYVALKVHAADVDVSNESYIQKHLKANSPKDLDSRFVLLLSDSFVLEGPNGRHSCFVTQPMGPSLSDVLHGRPSPSEEFDPLNPPSRRFPTVHTKRFLRNMLLGLKFLHENQIVHGDLQPGNILFHLQDLAGLDPKDLEQNQTNSKLDPLIRMDGKVDLWAPKYLAVHEPLTRVALPQDQQIVKLADFGGGMFSHCYYPGRNLPTNVSMHLQPFGSTSLPHLLRLHLPFVRQRRSCTRESRLPLTSGALGALCSSCSLSILYSNCLLFAGRSTALMMII